MPKTPIAKKKAQFSVLMDADVKAKLEQIAAFNNQSLAQHLEALGRAEIEAVDPGTWDMIERVIERMHAIRPRPLTRLRKDEHGRSP